MASWLGVGSAVRGGPEEPGAIGRWIKPYVGKDGFFDLKSVSTKAVGDEGRRYDFFELYWADQMSGTRLVAGPRLAGVAPPGALPSPGPGWRAR